MIVGTCRRSLLIIIVGTGNIIVVVVVVHVMVGRSTVVECCVQCGSNVVGL